jgi:hypothetical protein
MSVIKFELKEEHIKLLKHLSWSELTDDKQITTNGDNTPFGGMNHYEDMGIILYGQPEDFNPFDGDPFTWTDEQKVEMDKLLLELPLAIEIILYTQSFETGFYKARFHTREWKNKNK